MAHSFPPRPQPTGFKSVYLLEISRRLHQLGLSDPFKPTHLGGIPCTNIFSKTEREYSKTGSCSRGTSCQDAQDLTSEWQEPVDYATHRKQPTTSDSPRIRFNDWGTSLSPEFSVKLNKLFPTVVKSILSQEISVDAEAERFDTVCDLKLCYDFFFYQDKCPNWASCLDLHIPSDVFKRKAVRYFCKTSHESSGDPSLCSFRSKCPYAHSVKQRVLPKQFRTTFDHSGSVSVEARDSEMHVIQQPVPAKYLLSRDSLPLIGTLCQAQWCDEVFHESQVLHISLLYWQENQTRLPIPPSLERHISVQRPVVLTQGGSGRGRPRPRGAKGAQQRLPVSESTEPSVSADQILRGMFTFEPSSPAANYEDFMGQSLSIPGFVPEHQRLSRRFAPWYSAWFQESPAPREFLGHSPAPDIYTCASLSIGEGGTASVTLGYRSSDGLELAVKTLSYRSQTKNADPDRAQFKAEVKSLITRSWVPGIVRYYGSKVHVQAAESTLAIFLELMEGSILELLPRWKQDPCLWGSDYHLAACRYVVGCVLLTLRDLGPCDVLGSTICHHIKPGNILVDRLRQIRLLGFGESEEIQQLDTHVTCPNSGTRAFEPPEALKGQAHRTSDLYSLGLVLAYLVQGRATPGSSEQQQLEMEFPSNCQWPLFSQSIIKHFYTCVVRMVPAARAFFSIWREQSHRIMLVHPLFWNNQKCIEFIIALATTWANNNESFGQALEGNLLKALTKTTSGWQPPRDLHPIIYTPKHLPFEFLEFIRQTSTTAPQMTVSLLNDYPSVLTALWETLIMDKNSILLNRLRPFLQTPYHGNH